MFNLNLYDNIAIAHQVMAEEMNHKALMDLYDRLASINRKIEEADADMLLWFCSDADSLIYNAITVTIETANVSTEVMKGAAKAAQDAYRDYVTKAYITPLILEREEIIQHIKRFYK